MPRYMPSDDEMDSSYKSSPVQPPDKALADKAPQESVDEQNSGEAEILIAKDKLPSGTKEGATCTFRVAKDVGDEFILEYVKDGEAEASEPTDNNFDATTDKELSALDSQGQ